MSPTPENRRAFLALVTGVTAAVALTVFRPLAYAAEYPTRPVKIIVPFPPASSPDVVSRWLSPILYEKLGQPFVIEDKPGAGSVIGVDAVVRSLPDGYTLLMGAAAPMAINVTLHKSLPYDPTTDLVPLAFVARGPFVLVVTPSLPVHSVGELISLAYRQSPVNCRSDRQDPAPLVISTGNCSTMSPAFKLTQCPNARKWASQRCRQGQIPANVRRLPAPFAMYWAEEPPLRRPTSSCASRRCPMFRRWRRPEFQNLMLPAGSCSPHRRRRRVLSSKHYITSSNRSSPHRDFKEQIEAIGMVPMGDTADNASIETLQAFVKSEIVDWGKLVRLAGIAGSQ